MTRPRTILADDHVMVAQALARLLHTTCDVIAVVEDGLRLVETALREQPDLILADLAMPGLDGLSAIARLRERGLRAPAVLLTMHDDGHLATRCLEAGAQGYVVKQAAGEELEAAIHAVLAGGTYLGTDSPRRPASTEQSALRALTPRQLDVLRLTARGLSMKATARALGISPRTVETHKYDLMRILEAHTTADLVRVALRLGLE